jgi:TrmH family RNA methyltransferase
MNAKHITSLQNPLVKSVMKLKSSASERRGTRRMLVEGRAEIQLAAAAGFAAQQLIVAPDLAREMPRGEEGPSVTVSAGIFAKLSYREHPDGWLGIFETPQSVLKDLRLGERPLVIVLEGVEKPGNLGAVLRTADAAAVDALVMADSRTDIYGPNVVRASRGTIFSVPVAQATSAESLEFLQKRGILIIAASPDADTEYTGQDLTEPLAIVLGTESDGLSQLWLEAADAKVKIPMRGRANSLNVSIAAALLTYEALRQRAASSRAGG